MNDATPARPRRTLVLSLVALAAVVGFLAVFAVWAERQALETDTWTETSTELLEDEDIQTAVGSFLVDELYANVDVEALLAQRLPPQASALAGPAAGALRELANRAAVEALARPRVQELWEEANRTAHERLIAFVEGDSEALTKSDGAVTLDLGTLLTNLSERTGIGGRLTENLPEDAAQIVILRQDQIGTGKDVVNLLRGLAIVLTILALGLFALAIYLARAWRREALRAVGFAFIAVGIAVLLARGAGGNYLTDQLASTASLEPPIEATWSIGTSLLADSGGGMLFYGIVIILGAWLAAPIGVGREVRRELTPILMGRGTAYAALAVLLLLLFWWSPTPGFDRLPTSILLIILMVIGLEALRRQAIRDFPEQTLEAGQRRWRDFLRR
jgi:hypothetical protein